MRSIETRSTREDYRGPWRRQISEKKSSLDEKWPAVSRTKEERDKVKKESFK